MILKVPNLSWQLRFRWFNRRLDQCLRMRRLVIDLASFLYVSVVWYLPTPGIDFFAIVMLATEKGMIRLFHKIRLTCVRDVLLLVEDISLAATQRGLRRLVHCLGYCVRAGTRILILLYRFHEMAVGFGRIQELLCLFFEDVGHRFAS